MNEEKNEIKIIQRKEKKEIKTEVYLRKTIYFLIGYYQ